MLEKVKNKIEKTFTFDNNDGNNKKKIENLVVCIVILIITVVAINVIWNDDNKQTKKNTDIDDKVLAKTEDNDNNQIITTELEGKLENILKNIEGVGNVKVLLTYSESSKTMAMYNEDNTKSDTEETDTSGGNRKISQTSNKKEIIYQEVNGEKIPITQSVITPKIEGAVITAVGARNSTIKTNIIQAVEAVTGLATHKIQVFEMAN